MDTTKLIIIRHGESLGNLNKIYLGHTNWDLSELGYRQAEITANYLADVKIDAVYSSDLLRAYNTVLPIAKMRGLEIIKDKNLREVFAGEWEGKSYDELWENYSDDFKIWRTDIGNARCTGGESVMELKDRIFNAVKKIAKENSGKTVCIGTHATALRALNGACNNISKDDFKNIPWVSNASVTYAEFDGENLIMTEYGKDDFLNSFKTTVSSKV